MAKKKRKITKSEDDQPIEESMQELQRIVHELEGGQAPLDDALKQFERGMVLLRTCHRQLDEAAARIELLTGFDENGDPVTTDFDGTATADRSDSDDESDTTLF